MGEGSLILAFIQLHSENASELKFVTIAGLQSFHIKIYPAL